MALLCLRATPIDHALPSPAELLYNRKVTAKLPTKCPNNERNKEAVHECLEARLDSQKSYFDQRAKDLPPLNVGQKVSVEDPTTGCWKAAVMDSVLRCRMEMRQAVIGAITGKAITGNTITAKYHHTLIYPAQIIRCDIVYSFHLSTFQDESVSLEETKVQAGMAVTRAQAK